MRKITIDTGWTFKQRDPARVPAQDAAEVNGWMPASVPGGVHLDLMAAGQLPDPFVDMREKTSQWVGERDWWYRCRFTPPELRPGERATLDFEGLDTFAAVWINGLPAASSDNMFVPLQVDVTRMLQPGENEVLILFESALRVGHALESRYGQRAVWNGDASRVFVRKAQYHYGWDWGPVLMAAGVWRPVALSLSPARIEDAHVETVLNAGRDAAALNVTVNLSGAANVVSVEVVDPDGRVVAQAADTAQDGQARIGLAVGNVRLWQPRGYGEQALYTARVVLRDAAGAIVDSTTRRFGLRDVRLVQAPVRGEPGASFTVEVNGVEMFCGGANWIPADNFTTRIDPARYRRWLELAANANMRMVRVWGGGIFEADVFYNLCDELGLLVWQDFLFGCGMYPAHPEFIDSVRREAEAQVRRLRHHPSLALWAGNNEDYQIAESTRAHDPAFQGDFTQTAFPARELYERTLPEVVARLDPGRAYWPGSPYTPNGVSTDPTIGDRHTWDVWHGAMADYQDYPRLEGRFVSEFGMASAPRRALIERYVSAAERTPRSETMDWHNKAEGGPRRIATYMIRNICDAEPTDLDDYIYLSQFNQAEAMTHAFAGWRRRWGTPGGRAVSGALVWQLNDCWPVTSWAIADYDAIAKPAWYATRRALAPIALGLRRDGGEASAWVVNESLRPVTFELEVRAWSLDGALRHESQVSVAASANASTEIRLGIPPLLDDEVLSLRGFAAEHALAASAWREPYKGLPLPDPGLVIARSGTDTLTLRVARPAKGVWLSAPGAEIDWSDNFLDLCPGDAVEIRAPGLGERPVSARWLGARP
jgi:beta-mannosidase